jgi:hypothetical protein
MKKLFFALTAASALAVGAPAAAQYGYNTNANANIDARIGQLEARLDAGLRDRTIDWREARDLRRQLSDLRQLDRRYSYNGYTQQERADMQQRLRYARQSIRTADNGRYDRDTRYGAWDDGYDTRYGNRYGYGQGGPYDEVSRACAPTRGISGILGSILGSDNCLTVGERVSSWNSMSALPSQHRGSFRDDGRYYHRYLNGNIVQIDGRTGTVVRIYDVD